MPVAPDLEVLLEVDELFAALVFLPVLLRVLVDDAEDIGQFLVEGVGDRFVSVEEPLRHRKTAPGQAGEELVVDARFLEVPLQGRTRLGFSVEDREHGPILVAEQELHGPVLPGLEAGGTSELVAEPDIFARRQSGEDRPLLGQGLLDVFDPGDALERGLQLIGGDEAPGVEEFVDDEPEPQLRGLVLDDEEQLIVVFGTADWMLGAEETVEVEIRPVCHRLLEVGVDPGFEVAFVLLGRRPSVAARVMVGVGHDLQHKGQPGCRLCGSATSRTSSTNCFHSGGI